MKKIALIGTDVPHSLGVQAMTISSMLVISKYIPDAHFIMFSQNPSVDERLYCRQGFVFTTYRIKNGWRVIKRLLQASLWSMCYRFIKLDISLIRDDVVLKGLYESEISVFMFGDAFSSDTGKWGGKNVLVGCSISILLSWLMAKPIILFPNSIGPLPAGLIKDIAGFSLNRASIIVAREELTKVYLKEIAVDKPIIQLTADLAFLLPLAPEYKPIELSQIHLLNKKGLIGINISQHIINKSMNTPLEINYIKIMIDLVDFLTEEMGIIVLLIPHSTKAKDREISDRCHEQDDAAAIKEVYENVRNKAMVIPLTNEYSAQEVKWFIGQCNLFVGARMHSLIAALSQAVPTVAISYSIKTPGIMKMMHMANYVCDYSTLTIDDLKRKVIAVWQDREQIKEQMLPRVELLKETVWYNGKMVQDLLTKSPGGT